MGFNIRITCHKIIAAIYILVFSSRTISIEEKRPDRKFEFPSEIKVCSHAIGGFDIKTEM